MRIAIDTTPLSSGHKLRGVGIYSQYLIEALKSYDKNNSYYFFTRGQSVPKGIDLVHYPYFDPFFLTLPFWKRRLTVVTVHDLIPVVFTQHFPRGLRGEFKWQMQKLSLLGASAIITDSLASQRDITSLTGIDARVISVVYLAPRPVFRKISELKLVNEVKKAYHLPEKFILYVGDLNWNKNIPGLLGAFAKVREEIGERIKLILVGKQFLNEELAEKKEMDALIEKLSLTTDVQKLGFVPDERLAVLYSLAAVYIQPSFVEGFGFPILEAMACGCPVISASTSSLPEIAGPARLFDPTNVTDIARAVVEVIKLSSSQRNKLISQGEVWVKQFSWKKVARETAQVYEKALG